MIGSHVDGYLNFDTRVDTNGYNRGVKNISNSLGGLRSSLAKVGLAIGAAFSVKAVVDFGKTCISTATDVENAWVGLNSIINGQGKSFDNAKKFIQEYISDGLVPLKNAVIAYKNLSLRGYNEEQIETVMTAFKNSATYARQSQYTLGDAISTATEGLKNENSIVVDNAGVTKNVAKMWEDYAKSIGASSTSLTKQQKIEAEVAGIIEETKFQMNDAAKYANTYSGQMARLSATFTNLKTKIGNILKVIVGSFLPIINNAISVVEKLADKVNSLFNSWGIQTDIVDTLSEVSKTANDSTDSLTATADSMDETAEAAKKLENRLAGFDKLNVLNTSDETTSNDSINTGVEPAIDTTSLIDTGKVAEEATNIFARSIERFKKLLAGGDFEGAGRLLTSKIGEQLAKIDWEEIRKIASKWGKNIASFLNGAIDGLDWKMVGATIGNSINTAIDFAYEFLTTFDWVNFGMKIADGINGAIKTIDWKKLGETLGAKTQAIISTAWGFITTFDWDGAGKLFADTLNGFIQSIDFGMLASSISKLFIGIWTTAKEFITNIDWGEIGASIGEFIIGIDWIGLIQGPLADIFNFIFNPLSWFDEGGIMRILWDLLTGIFEGLGVIDYWADLIGGFLPVIQEVWQNICDWFSGLWQAVCDWIKSVWDGVVNIFNGVGDWFKGVFQGAADSIKNAWNGVTGFFSGIWTGIKNTFSKVTNWFGDVFSKAWQAVKDVFSKGGEVFNGIKDGILNALKAVINGLIDGINTVIAIPFNGINTALGKIKEIEIAGWKPFEWISTIETPQIPKLATGTVVPANYGEFAAILGDNKREPEIVSPVSAMKQAMREVMAEANMSTNSNSDIHITLKVGDETLTKVVVRASEIYKKRHGGRCIFA